MELAAGLGPAQPGRLITAAISAVFTIGYVTNLLGEDENWIFDLSINMFPEDGCLWVHGVGEDGVPAFTETASKTRARSLPMRELPTADYAGEVSPCGGSPHAYSIIPPGGTPPWGIARSFAANSRCKQIGSPPPPEPSTKPGQLQ